mgnify:CR=1 FL=1
MGNRDFKALLRRAGATEDDLREFDQQYVPKSDFTRVRQQDAQQLRDMQQKVDYLMSQSQGGSGGANGSTGMSAGESSPDAGLEESLKQLGLDPKDNADLFKLMLNYGQKVAETAYNRTLGQLSPVLSNVTRSEQERALEKEREKLRDRFGDTLDQYWDEVKTKCQDLMTQGYVVSPRAVFEELYPDEAEEALYQTREQRMREQRNKNNSLSTEGFIQTRRTEPLSTPAENSEEDDTFDAESLANEVLRELGI